MIYPLGSIILANSSHGQRYFKIVNQHCTSGKSFYILQAVGDTRDYMAEAIKKAIYEVDGAIHIDSFCMFEVDEGWFKRNNAKLLLKGGMQNWKNYNLDGSVKVIDRFRGQYFFLSNFYPVAVGLFPHAEAAFQSYKCSNPIDKKRFEESDLTGAQARALGRKVALSPDWEKEKVGYMRDVVHAKFQNPDLRKKLTETGDAVLIEGNEYDGFWGVCGGKGENMLGMLLMEERAIICANQF